MDVRHEQERLRKTGALLLSLTLALGAVPTGALAQSQAQAPGELAEPAPALDAPAADTSAPAVTKAEAKAETEAEVPGTQDDARPTAEDLATNPAGETEAPEIGQAPSQPQEDATVANPQNDPQASAPASGADRAIPATGEATAAGAEAAPADKEDEGGGDAGSSHGGGGRARPLRRRCLRPHRQQVPHLDQQGVGRPHGRPEEGGVPGLLWHGSKPQAVLRAGARA